MINDLTENRGNYLIPIQAKFFIKRMPNVNFTCQRVKLPGIMSTPAIEPTPLVNIHHAGDTLYYDELVVEFLVSEYMENWLEIFEWKRALNFPEDSRQYLPMEAPLFTQEGRWSDAIVTMLDDKGNPKLEAVFDSVFPISISGIDFDTTRETPEPVVATATFRFTNYKINKPPGSGKEYASENSNLNKTNLVYAESSFKKTINNP